MESPLEQSCQLESLRQKAERYRRMAEVIPQMAWVANVQGEVEEFSSLWHEYTGQTRDTALGFGWMKALLPEDVDVYLGRMREVLAKGEPSRSEYRLRRGSDGSYRWHLTLAQPMKDENGTILYWFGCAIDIEDQKRAEAILRQSHAELEAKVAERTAELMAANEQLRREIEDRKRAEKALRQSLDELQAIYEGTPDGLHILDLETMRPIRINQALCRMIGYTEEETRSLSPAEMHPPEDLPAIAEVFHHHVANNHFPPEEIPLVRKDGSVFYVEVTASRIVYDERPCLMCFFRDITERRQAEEAMRREHRTLKHLLQSSDHERQLIAYEIHDGLAQHLAGAMMQLETYRYQKDVDPTEAGRAFDAATTMLRQGHFEARRLISGVRPPILDESGIVAAVAHLVNEQRVPQGPKIEFLSDVSFDRLVPIVENAAYRIVQEGLNNAVRHSQSKRIRVEVVPSE